MRRKFRRDKRKTSYYGVGTLLTDRETGIEYIVMAPDEQGLVAIIEGVLGVTNAEVGKFRNLKTGLP